MKVKQSVAFCLVFGVMAASAQTAQKIELPKGNVLANESESKPTQPKSLKQQRPGIAMDMHKMPFPPKMPSAMDLPPPMRHILPCRVEMRDWIVQMTVKSADGKVVADGSGAVSAEGLPLYIKQGSVISYIKTVEYNGDGHAELKPSTLQFNQFVGISRENDNTLKVEMESSELRKLVNYKVDGYIIQLPEVEYKSYNVNLNPQFKEVDGTAVWETSIPFQVLGGDSVNIVVKRGKSVSSTLGVFCGADHIVN
jgi:hypothetical protein